MVSTKGAPQQIGCAIPSGSSCSVTSPPKNAGSRVSALMHGARIGVGSLAPSYLGSAQCLDWRALYRDVYR